MTGSQSRQQTIELAEAKLNGILEAAVDGIIVIDARGEIEVFNQAAERIFGYAAGDVIGSNVRCLMPPPYQEAHDGYIDSFIRTREARIIGKGREVMGLRRNGEVFPMELAVGEASGAGGTRFVGLVRDISSTRRMEERLAALDHQFQLVFEEVPVGVFIADLTGRFESVNPWLCEFLEWSADELARKTCYELAVASDAGELEVALHRLVSGEKATCTAEVTWVTASDRRERVGLHASLVERGANKTHIIALVVDRTAEAAQREAAAAAQQQVAHTDRLNVLGEMASAIAHEVNQPLTAISAYAQACQRLLQAGRTSTSEISDVLERIAEQAQRGGSVVRRIRGFAASAAEARHVRTIGDIMDPVLELARIDARMAGVQIVAQINAADAVVLADEVQIQQVCLNLIRNAIDAIASVPEARRVVTVGVQGDDDQITVSVEDRGCGIDSELESRLFEPFVTSKENGLGMGLAISQRIISEHGGQLSCRNAAEHGAVFSFTLPLAGA